MPQIGPMEILVVGILALMVFGPEKLPDMARSVGRVLSQVKKMASEAKSEFDMSLEDKDDDAKKTTDKADDTVAAGSEAEAKNASTGPAEDAEQTPAPVAPAPVEGKASLDTEKPSAKEPVMATKS